MRINEEEFAKNPKDYIQLMECIWKCRYLNSYYFTPPLTS